MKQKKLIQKLQEIKVLLEECLSILSVSKIKYPKLIKRRYATTKKSVVSTIQLVFGINSRAFFKKYAKKMTGPQKFVLVVSFLTKGRIDKDVNYNDIKMIWNRHSGLFGGKLTSRIYGTRAKENEWLDSPKHGVYRLSNKWKEALIVK